MQVLKSIAALHCFLDLQRQQRLEQGDRPPTVGLVPTMGALHAGHRSLIERSRSRDDLVIVSIFVNPLQFAPQEDWDRYPRDLAADLQVCTDCGVDAVFAPDPASLGMMPAPVPSNAVALTQVVPPTPLTDGLCGRSRPDHFQGVATIVTKLLNLVRPDRAYFGRKDAQQLAILQRLVADLNLPVELVPCPIARADDGLAYSSRNRYLSSDQHQQALTLSQGLFQAQNIFRAGERSRSALIDAVLHTLDPALRLDYVDLVDPHTLEPLAEVTTTGLLAIAVWIEDTRLIDNVLLSDRRPIVAIDGPAGAGKSTVTRQVAAQLGLLYLDTGAMYRAVAWQALQLGIDPGDRLAMAELAHECRIYFGAPTATGEPSVWINDQDVTTAVRSPEVTAQVSVVAAHPEVRRALVAQQRTFGPQGGLVAEGRDIGTTVFPDAEVKIFLTATPRERARRRQQDLRDRGQTVPDLDQLEQEITQRDHLDSTRAESPLCQAIDAWELVTDGMTIAEVVTAIGDRTRALTGWDA